jgi:hypothetical protein
MLEGKIHFLSCMSGGSEIEFHITAATNGHTVTDEYGTLVE